MHGGVIRQVVIAVGTETSLDICRILKYSVDKKIYGKTSAEIFFGEHL